MIDTEIQFEVRILTKVMPCNKNKNNCGMNQQEHIQKNNIIVVIEIENNITNVFEQRAVRISCLFEIFEVKASITSESEEDITHFMYTSKMYYLHYGRMILFSHIQRVFIFSDYVHLFISLLQYDVLLHAKKSSKSETKNSALSGEQQTTPPVLPFCSCIFYV